MTTPVIARVRESHDPDGPPLPSVLVLWSERSGNKWSVSAYYSETTAAERVAQLKEKNCYVREVWFATEPPRMTRSQFDAIAAAKDAVVEAVRQFDRDGDVRWSLVVKALATLAAAEGEGRTS